MSVRVAPSTLLRTCADIHNRVLKAACATKVSPCTSPFALIIAPHITLCTHHRHAHHPLHSSSPHISPFALIISVGHRRRVCHAVVEHPQVRHTSLRARTRHTRIHATAGSLTTQFVCGSKVCSRRCRSRHAHAGTGCEGTGLVSTGSCSICAHYVTPYGHFISTKRRATPSSFVIPSSSGSSQNDGHYCVRSNLFCAL